LDDVPAAIAAADIGLAPTRRNAFTDFSLSTKIFEYAAMGKPVVASRLPLIERTFPPGTVATYEPGNADDMAHRVIELIEREDERNSRIGLTSERVRDFGWERESVRYRALVDLLAVSRERGSTRRKR
jgi:glycosyltransferase involved in cell wall biosynthesis